MLFVIFLAVFGVIVAMIAKKKGRDPVPWFFYGAFLFIVAIVHVLVIEEDHQALGKRDCPHCYEHIDGRASICPHCRMEVSPTLQPGPRLTAEKKRKTVTVPAKGVGKGVPTRTTKTVRVPIGKSGTYRKQTNQDGKQSSHGDRWCPVEGKSFLRGTDKICPLCKAPLAEMGR